MKQISILLLIGFASFSLFGFFAMHMGMSSHDGGCFPGITQTADCSKQTDMFGFVVNHLDALKDVSVAIFAQSASAYFVVALALLASVSSLALFVSPPLAYSYVRYSHGELFRMIPKRTALHWLALHENSPAFS